MTADLPRQCWISCGTRFRWSAGRSSGKAKGTADFKAVPGEEAMKTIKAEHVPRLIRVFKAWKEGTDFRALRTQALKDCPGLTQIWEEPFQALYEVADGEIVVRFRQRDDAVEIAADLLKKAK
jgi:hypothetical protein